MENINEKMANKIELLANKISQFNDENVKNILWVLCYDPETFFEECGLTPVDHILLQKAILEACQKNKEDFNFGLEEQRLDSFGVKLNISNPIVRDTVIERCMDISKDPKELRKCILYICTREDAFEYEARRSFAFEMLNFSEKEQNFLDKILNRYCIGDLLKAMQAKLYPRIPNVVLAEGEKPKFEFSNHKLSSNKLLENEDLVRGYIIFVTKLEELGIDPGKVAAKKEEVENFYMLAAGVC